MQRTEERTFTDDDGTMLVKTTQLPALRAFKLMARLGKLLSPSIGQLSGVKFGAKSDMLAPAFMALFERLDTSEVEDLSIKVLEGTLVVSDGAARTLSNAPAIDQVFGGRILTLVKVMAFAVEVNFRDFFRALAKEAAEKAAAKAAAEATATPIAEPANP